MNYFEGKDLHRVMSFARKAEAWDRNVPLVTNAEVIAEAAKLPMFPTCEWPCEDFPEPRPRYHVAIGDDDTRFLVDTEGYSYARYIARLP